MENNDSQEKDVLTGLAPVEDKCIPLTEKDEPKKRIPAILRNFPANYFLIVAIFLVLVSLFHLQNNAFLVFSFVPGAIFLLWSLSIRDISFHELTKKGTSFWKVLFLALSIIFAVSTILWSLRNIPFLLSLTWSCGMDRRIVNNYPTVMIGDKCLSTRKDIMSRGVDKDSYKKCIDDSDCKLDYYCGPCGGKDFPINKDWDLVCDGEYYLGWPIVDYYCGFAEYTVRCSNGYCISEEVR
jgi:hypothetical protein